MLLLPSRFFEGSHPHHACPAAERTRQRSGTLEAPQRSGRLRQLSDSVALAGSDHFVLLRFLRPGVHATPFSRLSFSALRVGPLITSGALAERLISLYLAQMERMA